jgi:hypothetical protein
VLNTSGTCIETTADHLSTEGYLFSLAGNKVVRGTWNDMNIAECRTCRKWEMGELHNCTRLARAWAEKRSQDVRGKKRRETLASVIASNQRVYWLKVA